MIVFAGFDQGFRSNKVHILDFKSMAWSYSEVEGPKPCPRTGHSAVMYGDQMVVFGGKSDENQKLDDTWIYDVANNKWTQVKGQLGDTVPGARSGHSATVYRDRMVIFGGIFEVTRELNDTYVFDLKKCKWHL